MKRKRKLGPCKYFRCDYRPLYRVWYQATLGSLTTSGVTTLCRFHAEQRNFTWGTIVRSEPLK
jgi:hypothetical protein